MATGARSILEKRYNRFERIWSHCLKTGRYARRLAEIFNRPELPNRVFLGGVLHDIGQIVLLSIDLKTVNVISELVKNRKIRISTIIEEIAVGMSHSTIGGLIAEKWKFPPYLIQAIRHHHTPLQAETGSMEVVYIVYLANMFQGVEANRYQYTFFEAEVLTYFDIIGTEGLEQLHRQLKRDEDR
jgi:HD-like signal output (HDOD) protein